MEDPKTHLKPLLELCQRLSYEAAYFKKMAEDQVEGLDALNRQNNLLEARIIETERNKDHWYNKWDKLDDLVDSINSFLREYYSPIYYSIEYIDIMGLDLKDWRNPGPHLFLEVYKSMREFEG